MTILVGANPTATMYNGDTLIVPIIADMSAAAGRSMAAVQFDVSYDTNFVETLPGSAGTFGSATANQIRTGNIWTERIAVFAAVGTTTTVTLYTLRFVIRSGRQACGCSVPISVVVTTLADDLGASISSAGRNLAVTQINTGRPVALAVTTQPAGALSGQLFATQPVVQVRDATGAVSAVAVAVTATRASGTGTLSGTTTVNSVNGIATFANLQVVGAGSHTLGFASTGLVAATSNAFNVQPPATIIVAVGTDTISYSAPGERLALAIRSDMSQAAGRVLAAIQGTIAFDTARFRFDSLRAGAFGTLTANIANATLGTFAYSVFDAVGTTASQTLSTAHFTARTVGSTTLTPGVTVMGDDAGADLVPLLISLAHRACVVPATGRWGDANGDGSVNIIDAQQIARFVVGLPVASALKVQQNGDVTADGTPNIVDAQQVARFTVGLPSAARSNTVIVLTC